MLRSRRTPTGSSEVFDRLYAAPVRETSLVVIETDGTIEQSDALKLAYQGAAATGRHIVSNSFDEVLALPQMAATQLGLAALSDECRACIVGSVCDGGLYAHRYRAGHGFRNRSVYCEDLLMLITHIQARMAETLNALDTR
jgi:uncharacterized protein